MTIEEQQEAIAQHIGEICRILNEGENVLVTNFLTLIEGIDESGESFVFSATNPKSKCYQTLGLIGWAEAREHEHIAMQERHNHD